MSLRVGAIAGPVLAALVFATAAFGWRDIEILDLGFVPSTVEGGPAQDLHWTNESAGTQSVTSDAGLFDSGPIPPGGGFSMKLAIPGQHEYHSVGSPHHTGHVDVPIWRLAGPPTDLADDHIPDLPFPAETEADRGIDPVLAIGASRTRLVVTFEPTATVAQANAAVAQADVAIVGGLPNIGVLLVQVIESSVGASDAAAFALLRDAQDALEAHAAVDAAALDSDQALQSVPRPAATFGGSREAAAGSWTADWEWGDPGPGNVLYHGDNWYLEADRAPQAWNLLGPMLARNASTEIAVIDGGFDVPHPDLSNLKKHTLCRSFLVVTERCTVSGPNDHGNHVAGIVGGDFDNNPADGVFTRAPMSIGISGINPVASLHGIGNKFVPGFAATFAATAEAVDLTLDEVKPTGAMPKLRVINYSVGATLPDPTTWPSKHPAAKCGPLANDDGLPGSTSWCTPNNQDAWLKNMKRWSTTARRIAERASPDVMIVAAAGNGSDEYCVPFDDPVNCEYEVLSAPNESYFAWATRHWTSSLPNPIVIVEALGDDVARSPSLARARFSNDGGDISAPGVDILSSFTGGGWGWIDGTSQAAPQVTGAIGYLLAYKPKLTIAEVKDALHKWARRDTTSNPANSPGRTPQPRLDLFASLLSLQGAAKDLVNTNDKSKDGNQRRLLARPGLLNVELRPTLPIEPDGQIDMRDFRAFRDAWLQACVYSGDPGCPAPGAIRLDGAADNLKKDTNLDGCVRPPISAPNLTCPTGEDLFSRFDFNGDGRMLLSATAPFPLDAFGAPATPPNGAALTDLDVLESQWDPDPAKTEGWSASQLAPLMRSGDLEVHADDLLDRGAGDVEISVTTDGVEVVPRQHLRPTGDRFNDYVVFSVPGNDGATRIEVRGTSTINGERVVTGTYETNLLNGEDKRVDLCQRVSLTATPSRVPADGTSRSRILLKARECEPGDPVADRPITLELDHSAGGASLDLVPETTNARGEAVARFTAGTAIDTYRIAATVDLGNGVTEEATVDVETTPKLKIAYVWKQTIDDWHEAGSTRWTGAPAGMPDCTLATGIEYCLDGLALGLDLQTNGGIERAGTLAGGGTSFKLTERVANSLARSKAMWTLVKPDGTSENGTKLAAWQVLDPNAYTDSPHEGVEAVDDSTGIHVQGIQSVGDLPYHYNLSGALAGGTIDPVEVHAVRTETLLIPQGRGAIRFAAHPEQEIVFVRKTDGSLAPFQSCGVRNDDLTTTFGYRVASDAGDYLPGAISIGRKREYVSGDRPMPVGPGHLHVSYAFGAVAVYGNEPTPVPTLPDCSVPHPPDADFKGPTTANEGQPVKFHDRSTDLDNDIQKWVWDFGDGEPHQSGPNTHHMFPDNGTYTVRLTVKDAKGLTAAAQKQIVVANLPPRGHIDDTTVKESTPIAVRWGMNDPGKVDKTQLEWTITSTKAPWPATGGTDAAREGTLEIQGGLPAGIYPLTLKVTDKDGASVSYTAKVTVTPCDPDTDPDCPRVPEPPPPRPYIVCDPNVTLDAEETNFLHFVNAYRIQNGVPPLLGVSPTLAKAADEHADDMAVNDYMAHTGLDGRSPGQRAWDAGYPKSATVGENLATDTPTGFAAFFAWTTSTTGHNENMLDPAWKAVGIAREHGSNHWRWATSYGTVLDCPPPAPPSAPLSAAALEASASSEAESLDVAASDGAEPSRTPTGPGVTTIRETATANTAEHDRTLAATTTAAPDDPPVAAFRISDATPKRTQLVTFTNASRDASGAPIDAVLDFGDGSASVPLAPGESISHAYANETVHDAALTATDADGRSLGVKRQLTVASNLRVPLVDYLGPQQGIAGEQVTLKADLLDVFTPLAGKTLTFTIANVSVSAVTNAQGTAEATMLLTHAPGDYDLVVRFDGDAGYHWQEIHVPFTVVSNAPPVASPGGPYELYDGGALTLDGSASSDPDPGDQVASYAWDLNDDGTFGEVVGGTPNPIAWAQVQALVCGGTCERDSPYSIALKVTDTRGASATAKTTVKVISDFTLTLEPATQSLSPGSSNSFAVSLASLGGFASPVTLSVSGLPAGFTASFETNPITPPGVTALTITASQNAPEGVVPLTVVGTGGGITHQANSSVSVAFGLIPVCYGTFTGKVTDGETGEPLAGVVVGSYPTAVTDTQGLYTITQVPLGFNNASQVHYVPTSLTGYWPASKYGRAICGVVTRVDLQPIKVRYGAAAGRVMVGAPDPNDHTRNRKVTPTDTPLPDAKVTGYYPHGVSEADADGRYTRQLGLGHNNAAHGDWLRAEAPGYWWQDKFVNAEADVTKPVDFELVEKCEGTFVGGRLIHGETGQPLRQANVVVELYGTDYRWTRTDEDGEFGFNSREQLGYNNSPATYFVRTVTVTGGAYFTIDDCGVSVSKDIVVSLPPPPPVPNYGYLEGYVFDEETGQPVKGAYVHGAQTDAAGYYKTGKIFVGNDGTKSTQMYFNAWAPEYWQSDYVLVTVTADQTARKDFRILRQRRGTIEGTVRDAVTRQPIAGADVGGHSTDANGHYRIPNLGLGYRNAPQTYGYYAQKQGYWHQLKYVQVRAGETSTLDYELLKECSPARIVGVVLNASTQQPIAGASVYGGGASSTTNETGRFGLAGIRLGHGNSPYDVSVTASAPGFYSQTKIVTVFCGATISLDFGREQTKLGTIVGTVTNGATGAPIANAFVGSEYGASARTDAKGDYKLEGAPLGDDNADREWNVTVAPAGFLAQSRAVTVKADTEVRADFQFLPQANRAPVADAKTLVVDEDAVSPVRLTGSDPDDDPITFAVVTQPQHGTLSGTAPALTYIPAANYSGPDSFTYKAADGDLDSEPATVSITVEPVNDQPTAADDAAATDQNIPVEIPAASLLANDSDPDGDTLAVVAAFDATHGTVALEDATVTFTPESDYAGPAGFRYRVSDGHGGQAEAAVAVTVDASNAPPVTIDDAGTVAEDGSTVIDVLANDSPGAGEVAQQLTASLLTQPAHGVAIVTPTGISYAPAPNHNGPDTFDYQACDDGTPSECAPGTVAVDVTPVNDRPQGADGTIALDEDAPPAAVDLGALASDVETNTAQLTYEIVSAPAKGVLSGDGPVVHYDSSDNANGLDSFTFRIVDRGDPDSCSAQPRCDAPLASEVHTVTIEIAPLNDMPGVTLDPAGPLPEGGSVDLIAHGADPDSDPLTFAWHANGGTLHADGDTATLSADDGPAEIPVTVTVDDGALTAKADEVVAVVNVAPQVDAGPDRAARTGEPIEIESAFTDPGADTHTAKIDWGDGTVSAGTVTGRTVGGMHTYADDGTYTVSLTVEDDDAGIGSDSFTLTVAGVSPYLLVIDDESIDNGAAPNFFSASAVNDHIAKLALRAPLPAFDGKKIGSTYTLHTGQVGDEGWFAPKTIPAAWDVAGPTADGKRNFVGNPREPYPHHVGPGLGTRDAKGDRESLLGKVPRVTPLRATALALLAERRATVCGVVYDGDISLNYAPLSGSLKGANLGTVALRVLSARPLLGYSAGSLPQVEVEVLDARSVCERVLQLYADAPEPKSSSVPYDTGRSRPATRPPNLLSLRMARFGGLR